MYETGFFSTDEGEREYIDQWLNTRGKSFDIVGYVCEVGFIWITIKYK